VFTGSPPSTEERNFGWYSKRLAVVLSFSYLILFAVSLVIYAVSGRFLAPGGPAERVADLVLQFASSGDECETNWWDDQLLRVFDWMLLAFLGWFQYFAIGFVSGLSIDTVAALKRRFFRLP